MWIIRFHTLQSKDYNKIARLFKKTGFITRSISPVIYAKSLVYHMIQKRSLRNIAGELSVSHIALHKFILHIQQHTPELIKIFHVFLDARSIVYIGNIRVFSQHDLDNSNEIYTLTKTELESILSKY